MSLKIQKAHFMAYNCMNGSMVITTSLCAQKWAYSSDASKKMQKSPFFGVFAHFRGSV